MAFRTGNNERCTGLHEQVVKSEKREGNVWHFLLHYSGWGKRYDEWVAQSGLVKYDADVVSLHPSDDPAYRVPVACCVAEVHPVNGHAPPAVQSLPHAGG